MKSLRHHAPAILWDGHHRLSGTLELWEGRVVFRFEDFKNSHLSLVILIHEIERVETFQIYNAFNYGVRILNKKGTSDAFIIENAVEVKRRLEAMV